MPALAPVPLPPPLIDIFERQMIADHAPPIA